MIKINKRQKSFILVCCAAFLVFLINAVTITLVLAAPVTQLQADPLSYLDVFAAAIAVVGSGAAAGYAIAKTGSAAIAAMTEKDVNFVNVLIIVSLAEAIAIYGLIVGLLIILL